MGLKGPSDVSGVRGVIPGFKAGYASKTVELESSCGRRNVWCTGELRIYHSFYLIRTAPTEIYTY